MLTGMVVGTVIATLPDDGCETINIDGKTYKECAGTLYEPVYQDDQVQYKVVESPK